jgi:curved DNA-binding protein CbpA
MRTHYDNLKVSHDAPVEVINAAYRSLAKKYHPDKNGDSADSKRIIAKLWV